MDYKDFEDLSFEEIDNEHIKGEWRVENRIFLSNSATNVFVNADKHYFCDNGDYKCIKGKIFNGSWGVVRNDDVVHRPYLKFRLDNSEDSNQEISALITRLQYDKVHSKAQMTIYMSTGAELTLIK